MMFAPLSARWQGNLRVMIAKTEAKDLGSEQERKKSDLIRLLERLIEDVHDDRLFGEFTVSFSAQAGKIGHYEELRKRTFK